MDSSTGKIYTSEEIEKFTKEQKSKLTPFEIGETIRIKDCWFKIIYIRTDHSAMTLKGIPAPEKLEE